MKWAVRTVGELGRDLVLAPERHVVTAALRGDADAIPLADLVRERVERVVPGEAREIVLDTTHAKAGVLDVEAALAATEPARSAKKRARTGDVIVSRLRPYLRQIALVHEAALPAGVSSVAVSTEFYVLAPRAAGEGVGWLVPWLLSAPVQEALAAAQEGGHHPRVPRDTLFALRVPEDLVRARRKTEAALRSALADYYAASRALVKVLAR